MGIKAENTRRIRELEAEFSDAKIAELFHVDDVDEIDNRRRRSRRARKAVLRGVLVFAVLALCVVVALQFFSLQIMRDDSMGNTIENTDCVVVAKYMYRSTEVACGDIISHCSLAFDGEDGKRDFINRAIGLPGDVIEIREGNVYRNGERLNEPYAENSGALVTSARVLVPEGRYFVLGDNRQGSIDSRDARIGFVPEADIRGKVVFRLLPASRAGGLEGDLE